MKFATKICTDAPESMGFTVTSGNNIYINLEPDTRGEGNRVSILQPSAKM